MKPYCFVFVIVSGICFVRPAVGQIPPGFEVIQLTENSMRDAWPRINIHRQIVYERRLDRTDKSGEIFLYDDRTGRTIRLTDDRVKDRVPAINDDGAVAWVRYIGPDDEFGPTGEIMLRTADGVITRLTDNDTTDQAPSLNNLGHVAWSRHMGPGCRGKDRDIFFYDGQSIRAITTDGVPDGVANQAQALNDLDQIVWVRFDFCAGQGQQDWESEIRLYDSGEITTLTDGQFQPQNPAINSHTLVAWQHRPAKSIVDAMDLWQDGNTTALTNWGHGPQLNDAGVVAFNRWHDDTKLWQRWLYRDEQFWQLSDDSFWNRGGNLNEIGDVVWRSGPTTTSNIRYMRRFSLGDVNCDGSIDLLDIEPFILTLLDPEEYRRVHPTCDAMLADIDQDGSVDALDIEPFIALLIS